MSHSSHISWLRSITLVVLLAVFYCSVTISCTTLKHNTKTVVSDTATAITIQHDTVRITTRDVVKEYVHDTVITTPQATASATLPAADVAPLYTASGRKVPRVIHIDSGALHAVLTIDTTGNVHIAMRVDSSMLVIPAITERTRQQSDSFASVSKGSTATRQVHTITTTDIITRSKNWMGRNWPVLLMGGILLLFFELRLRLKKHFP